MRSLMSRRADDSSEFESVEEAAAEPVQTAAVTDETKHAEHATKVDEPNARRPVRSRLIAYGVLLAAAVLLALAAGFLMYQDASVGEGQDARQESVRAATESTIAMLSYRPDTVEKDLAAAQGRMTGTFLDTYTSLIHDVVIPGAKEKQISAVATVPAVASTSATGDHAVVLLFVNQTVTVGDSAPTNTQSSVRVTLDKVDGRWLVSQFEPI